MSPAPVTHRQIDVGPIELHVAELGDGPPVVFCHGFPDLWRGWLPLMEAVAAEGHRAIALDMRGYGRSAVPDDPLAYTPFHTVGDLVGLLDILRLPEATIVGHDFGASIAWYAAMMRPDRFTAVFGLSVPFLPPTQTSFLEQLEQAGQNGFYMIDQMRPEAVEAWADAAVTIPAALYWLSGSPPAEERWDPFDASRSFYRQAPVDRPSWADPDDVDYLVGEFQRTGFAAPLSYYRSIQPFFDLARPYVGARIEQPSFFMVGELDAAYNSLPLTEDELRKALPGLRGLATLDGVGHWPQREAPDLVTDALCSFLREISPTG